MTRRVLLGQRGSEYGLWVSKPGTDVVSAGSADLLFSSSDSENFMVVASGVISDPGAGATATVSIPNLGFAPFVIFSCEKYGASLEHLSNTSIRFRTGAAIAASLDDTSPTVVSRSGQIRYAVTNLPI